jgi:hypothetical protein
MKGRVVVPRVSARLASVIFITLCGSATAQAQDNPPLIEIGGVLSAYKASQFEVGNHLHWGGGGGRVTVNVTPYFAGEVESTRQRTGDPYHGSEVHTVIAAKLTYRYEQRRWLKVAGLNFFGVIGPAFVNRSVAVEGIPPGAPPSSCFKCTVLRRQTATALELGGGFEVVPARPLAVRFDLTRAFFSDLIPYSNSQTVDRHRTYVKVAVMVRVPWKGVLLK